MRSEQTSLFETPAPTAERPAAFATKLRDPQEVLERVFGYPSFRPGQREIIDAVLAGRDCVALMPTGAGKSLTFQIPARILPGAVICVSPLISLMKDQVDGLVRSGFRATVLNSTIAFDERRARLSALRRGEIELMFLAPEALEGSLAQVLAECSVSLLAIDESHCVSEWGHSFRPAYLAPLRRLREALGSVPVLALTATATDRVVADIVGQLGLRSPLLYSGSVFRPNLRITAQKKGTGRNGRADMLALLARHRGESAIVYCLSRRSVEETATWLVAQGIAARPYHAGLDARMRERNQDAFAKEHCDVIVATIAFGMGIDKSNVRLVLHRDMPRSIESWYQEIGRAGRDGLPSDCVVFYAWPDVLAYDRFSEDLAPGLAREQRERTRALYRLLEDRRCRHQAIARYFGEAIEPCGGSCDVCGGRDLDALVDRAPAPARVVSGARSAGPSDELSDAEGALFERLRRLRRELADEEGVPPYVIFNDATLRALAQRRPRSKAGLRTIPGVGPVKLVRYGERFLEVIRA